MRRRPGMDGEGGAWLVVFILLTAQAAFGRPLLNRDCDRVLVQLDDPAEAELGKRISSLACKHVVRLSKIFADRHLGTLQIRVLESMSAWRSRTGRAWYISAALVGDSIFTQPGKSLRMLDDLEGTLVHEIVHLLVKRASKYKCPRWLDEGLAQWLSGQRIKGRLPADESELSALESRLRSPDVGRKQRLSDYRDSLALVSSLIDQVGRGVLVQGLAALKDLENPLDLKLSKLSLRQRLFSANSGKDAGIGH